MKEEELSQRRTGNPQRHRRKYLDDFFEIFLEVADKDPMALDLTLEYCFWCDSDPHKEDCTWVRARKIYDEIMES